MCDQCDGLYGNTFKPGDFVFIESGFKRPQGIGKVLSVSGNWASVEMDKSTYDVLYPWLRKVKQPVL